MGIDPQLINHSPAANSMTRKRHVRFSIYEEDVAESAHVGRLVLDSINVTIDYGDGRGYQAVITGGEVIASGYCELFDVPNSMTGQHGTGQMPTGRHLQTLRVHHTFEQKVADGTRVTLRVQAEDAAGNSMDETFYFDMWQWTSTPMPRLEFYEGDTLAEAMRFMFHQMGTEQDKSYDLWWGKGVEGDYTLDAVNVEISGGSKNVTGKEFIDEGYLLINDEVVGTSAVVLSGMTVNSSQAVKVGLSTASDAASSGLVALVVTLTPIKYAYTGCGWTGRELTGGPINIGDVFGRPRNFTILVNCITSGLAALYESCGLTWEES